MQLQLVAPGALTDAIGDLCLQLGSLSITLADAAEDALDPHQGILEPPPGSVIVWENVVISSLWEPTADFSQVRAQLNEFLLNDCLLYTSDAADE